jgi:putative component of toxin-antitoxin plasmid stabilization module
LALNLRLFNLKVNYEIVELDDFTGKGATVYSVIMECGEVTLFDEFLQENMAAYREEVKSIIGRLKQIGSTVGARAQYFKQDEGKPGDGVCALYDEPDSKLRLYCIRYGNVAIILGGGGPKSKNIKAWQEDDKLKKEAELIIRLSKDISNRIQAGDLEWSKDGYQLLGNLIISDDDE